jgi:hypothetical protein
MAQVLAGLGNIVAEIETGLATPQHPFVIKRCQRIHAF